ncbi:MAG: hypothetical protein AAF191_19895, partial [Verrucomicrobiota bacterium]
WNQAATIEQQESGEYSYPAMIQTRDGLVHLTYTWKRRKVNHVVVDPAKLVAGQKLGVETFSTASAE